MSQPWITLEPFTLAGPLPAQAPLLWEWRYTGDGILANGTLISTSRPDANGYYQISGITGSRNGESITGLEPTGDAIPGNEGYPVDNLISPGGSLTVNGFGYETADGNYANPYYANYLTPPIYQEMFTQPTSSGFSEVPIAFQANRIPGVTIATVTPAFAGDALSLAVIQAPRSGTLSLYGLSVQYVPASKPPLRPVTFSFDVQDEHGSTTPVVTVIAAGDGSHKLSGAASGYTDISLGNGDNAIALSGSNNSVTVGSGADTVRGGYGDTINLDGNTKLAIYGTDEMVFVGDGNAAIDDRSTGLQLQIGPTTGHNVIVGFASDPSAVVDLTGGIGGFTDTATVLSALKSDGRGGTLLSFGNGHFLDFYGVMSSQLHAANFQVG
jgi:hypothetical protein